MKKVDIYTDGACSGNPGPGGWACILIHGRNEKSFSGFTAETTNNRMELTAVIKGLEQLKEPCEVRIFSDSAYIINAFTQGWIDSWLASNWKRGKRKEPVLNKDLWKELLSRTRPHKITWNKVKGHSGNPYNEKADKMAVAEIRKDKSPKRT